MYLHNCVRIVKNKGGVYMIKSLCKHCFSVWSFLRKQFERNICVRFSHVGYLKSVPHPGRSSLSDDVDNGGGDDGVDDDGDGVDNGGGGGVDSGGAIVQ